MTEVQGRTAFITGGANGIGLGIARTLASAQVKLALADIDGAALAAARAELEPLTPVQTFLLDVRDREAYSAAGAEADASLGPVSLLFNNAGVVTSAPPEKLGYALWDWVIDINLKGVINGIQTFLPKMIERGEGGHVVNTASGAGLAATSSGVLYCTSKFGVVGMSEALHGELASAGIGVSVLCPGPVATGIVARSSDAAPEPGSPLSSEQEQRMTERRSLVAKLLGESVGVDEVGAMVLNAIQGNRLYIHTDRLMEEPIKQRTRSLLDAMPQG